MKIAILGAGISGLSIARLLSKEHEVQVLERKSHAGGIARTRTVDLVSYHLVGGHCFNSRYSDVMDWVFKEVMPQDHWNKITRSAVIKFKGHEIRYPIEFAVKEIFAFDKELALNITRDFLVSEDDETYSNLEQWFRKKFGHTLAEEYFIPYNAKIWNRKPADMDPAWVEGKLPIPNKVSFFESLIDKAEDKMPHSEFYYPKSNNQNTFLEALSDNLKIVYDLEVRSIGYSSLDNRWLINKEMSYDLVISTLPMDVLPHLIEGCPDRVKEAAGRLKYNKVSNVLWESQPTTHTWTYIPDSSSLFHRYIHIGNFFRPVKNVTITEAIGEKTYDEMVESGKKDSFLIKPLDYHVSDHAYVVFDEHYHTATETIKAYLSGIGIHTHGRFGEWQYYNMDVCIKKSIDLSQLINSAA
ncbi:protoporphyrinogen/coproporphyrinogen oxidase [Arcticibacter sp.]|jgi:protoporphyrinogen oxidase|uniref:protoporphyrinogen/coproporphyrinogen oxidase n=1 Tax=Arcticibacter sp. TaxID=1872630 RepID=UPI00388E6ADC